MYYIPTTYLTVRDDEGPIVFQREDLMRYSGNRGLIASGVTFRLLGAAFEDLCPNEIPHREYFRFRTSFPGDEVRDGIELVTRAVLKGRYFVILQLRPILRLRRPPTEQCTLKLPTRQSFCLQLDHNIFTKEWADEVIKHQEGSLSEEEHARYLEYKYEVLGKLLTRMNVFNYREPIPVTRLNR